MSSPRKASKSRLFDEPEHKIIARAESQRQAAMLKFQHSLRSQEVKVEQMVNDHKKSQRDKARELEYQKAKSEQDIIKQRSMEITKTCVVQAKVHAAQSKEQLEKWIQNRNKELHDEAEALRSMIEAAHTAQISEDKTKIAEITAENIARKQEFAERRQKRELQEAKERRSVQQAVADERVANKALEAASQKTRKDALNTAKAAARENRDKALAKEADRKRAQKTREEAERAERREQATAQRKLAQAEFERRKKEFTDNKRAREVAAEHAKQAQLRKMEIERTQREATKAEMLKLQRESVRAMQAEKEQAKMAKEAEAAERRRFQAESIAKRDAMMQQRKEKERAMKAKQKAEAKKLNDDLAAKFQQQMADAQALAERKIKNIKKGLG